MLGAITGDIIGSVHERRPTKSTEFPLFVADSRFTDDTVLTVATAFSLLTDGDYAANYRLFGTMYPLAGYGGSFRRWVMQGGGGPYNSWGNGSAMRVSPVAWALDTEAAVLAEAERSAAVTHDHPEGIKGAQAVALAIFLARGGADRDDIRTEIAGRFGYDLDRRLDDIRTCYTFDVSCQGSVPESLLAFLEGDDWEHAVRLAVSLGGDADTMACIAGAVGEAWWGGVPEEAATRARAMLPPHMDEIVRDFAEAHMTGPSADPDRKDDDA